MTVAEYIEKLSKMPQDLEVVRRGDYLYPCVEPQICDVHWDESLGFRFRAVDAGYSFRAFDARLFTLSKRTQTVCLD
jgi:hypothetical protein